jgi:hypothetical protein
LPHPAWRRLVRRVAKRWPLAELRWQPDEGQASLPQPVWVRRQVSVQVQIWMASAERVRNRPLKTK